MNCELCHKNPAEVALPVEKDGAEDELYVCKKCAREARHQRARKSQRTRHVKGLPPGMSMSVTEISGEDAPPPVIEALMEAVNGFAQAIGEAVGEGQKDGEAEGQGQDEGKGVEDGSALLPLDGVDARFIFGSRLHLEGLFLLGDLESVHRALHALGMELAGVEVDNIIHDAGHAFNLRYTCSLERAQRVLAALVEEERKARKALFNPMQRTTVDAICRALAILKNCHLLTPHELFDLLSPLALAANQKLLDGMTIRQMRKIVDSIDLDPPDKDLSPDDLDMQDGVRADKINARFEDVFLNEREEGCML